MRNVLFSLLLVCTASLLVACNQGVKSLAEQASAVRDASSRLHGRVVDGSSFEAYLESMDAIRKFTLKENNPSYSFLLFESALEEISGKMFVELEAEEITGSKVKTYLPSVLNGLDAPGIIALGDIVKTERLQTEVGRVGPFMNASHPVSIQKFLHKVQENHGKQAAQQARDDLDAIYKDAVKGISPGDAEAMAKSSVKAFHKVHRKNRTELHALAESLRASN